MSANEIQSVIRRLANPQIAAGSQRFFKTGPGEYGEGDLFLGIRVPVLRARAKELIDTPIADIRLLLCSKFHEERLLALLILVNRFDKSTDSEQSKIYKLYLANTRYINNWDLVDASAHLIVGPYLQERNRAVLVRLARSKDLWERRIAMMACFHFIRRHEFEDAIQVSKILINDHEDLIHKSVGWMLREIGKRDLATEKAFLKEFYRDMPRTMLRYAIEKFPEPQRRRYLAGTVR